MEYTVLYELSLNAVVISEADRGTDPEQQLRDLQLSVRFRTFPEYGLQRAP